MALSVRDATIVVPRLRRLGVKMPVRALMAARAAGIPAALAASVLAQETGGGRNVWGHDPVPVGYPFGGDVTPANYRAYVARRRRDGNRFMQGVGPLQLTWWEFQDDADRAGGADKPLVNMTVGFRHLAGLIRAHGLHDGVRRYNGSGPRAEAYADRVLERAKQYEKVINPPRRTSVLRPAAHLTGDFAGLERGLQLRLARVARELRVKIHVQSGLRTRAEQTALWERYQTCLRLRRGGCVVAARPGTSRHESGIAADASIRGINIGDFPGARAAMKRHGLSLPVPGEPWHVEPGSIWRA